MTPASVIGVRMGRLVSHIWLERTYPALIGVVGAAASWCFGWDLTGAPAELLGAAVSFGAIASGFVGTSLAILTSLGTPIMQQVRRTKYVRILRGYMGWALASGVLLSCVSVVGLFPRVSSVGFTAAWCGVSAFCIACLYRLAAAILLVFGDPENAPK